MATQSLNSMIDLLRGQLRDTGPSPIFARAVETSDTDPIGKPDELQQFVEASIMDYSQYQPYLSRMTLVLLEGQLEYDLPADFIEMASFPFGYEVYGSKLLLSEYPDYDMEVKPPYRAMNTAETIKPFHVPAVIDYAMARALRAVVADSKKLDQFIAYDIPDVIRKSTDNTSEAVNQIRATANDLEKQYLAKVKPAEIRKAEQGPVMTFG